jgi:hypothetical protein
MKRTVPLLIALVVATVGSAGLLDAQTTSSPTNSPANQTTRPIPFHGMVSAVDQQAKTFTISGKEKSRTFRVTDKTKILRAGKAAAMKDLAENQEVSGAAWQSGDGTLEAKLLKLGPMEKANRPAASPTASPKP